MTDSKRLLVVDDEANIRRILQVAFEREGYHVTVAEDAYQAMRRLEENPFQCVLTDVTMPGADGYQLQHAIAERYPQIPVVIMTAYGTIPRAIQAIRDGAFEYVTKPFDLDSLKKVITLATEDQRPPKQKRAGGKAHKGSEPRYIAESAEMKQVFDTVHQVADARATVLITGESGVGKEVVAKALHQFSSRNTRPYVALSCAAFPESLLESELFGYEKGAFTGANQAKPGRFELANTGTLFLDEIGDVPATVQVKLLRVLQEREFERLGGAKPTKVDVRLVTATNRDLQAAVDIGTFRLDLLYRLQVVEIEIPPLRNRLDDILPLANFFAAKYANENGRGQLAIGQQAAKALLAYKWPGNVRELENTMERAVVLSHGDIPELTLELLPPAVAKAA